MESVRLPPFLFFTAVCLFLEKTQGYSGGAPCQAQHSLKPNPLFHGNGITALSPPYNFAVMGRRGKQIKRYKPGSTYTIRLHSWSHFRGFLIQPRTATKRGQIIGHLRAGHFKEEPEKWQRMGIQFQDCPPVMDNSITHINNSRKFEVTAKWTPKNNYGPIQFYVTVVQEKTVYWAKWKPKTGFLMPIKRKSKHRSRGQKVVTEKTPLQNLQDPQTYKSTAAEAKNTPEDNTEIAQKPPVSIFSVPEAAVQSPSTSTEAPPTQSPAAEIKIIQPPAEYRNKQYRNRIHTSNTVKKTETTPSADPAPPAPAFPSLPTTAPTVSTTFTSERTEEFQVETEKKGQAEDENLEEQLRFGLRRLVSFPEENIFETVELEPEEKTGACRSDPCLNGGSCINLEDGEGFVCLCKDKFTGDTCEIVDHCHGHECVYGVCRNEENGYTCECYDEYVGNRCERHCPSYLCEHGGTCLVTSSGDYECICPKGWTGDRCQIDADDCVENGCQNGAECIDQMNGYKCKCADGYMGEMCHRPCQNIYKSCETWENENRCAAMRPVTKFFDINCAVSCHQCTLDNSTISTDTPMPPILEPFEFLIGEWVSNYTSFHSYPLDFSDAVTGYVDKLTFSVPEVLMFGTPAINYSLTAISNHEDQIQNNGFLTVNSKSRPGGPLDVALLSTGNDGITLIEEGTLEDKKMTLKSVYLAVYPQVEHLSYEKLERNFTLTSQYLRVTAAKTKADGTKHHFTKYYSRDTAVRLF